MKHFLTTKNRENLKEKYYLETYVYSRDWIKAILLRDGNMTYGKIGKMLFLNEETISHKEK